MRRRNHSALQRDSDLFRTFICIEIPQSIKERIDALQRTLRQADAQVSWTKPSNIHLTLKFLGGVSPTRIERVAKAVERAASGIHQFEIEVSGAGCFPSPRSPRVLWIGLPHPPEQLKQLYANIEDELAGEGFPRENRKFSPHLTIGRIRQRTAPGRTWYGTVSVSERPASDTSTTLAEALIASGFSPETFEATEVIVMRSQLKPTGSIYTAQATIKLES